MAKFQVFTLYKADGTKIVLYGSTVEDALDQAGYTTALIAQEIRGYRKGFDDSLEFKNGKWHEKPQVKVKIEQEKFNKN